VTLLEGISSSGGGQADAVPADRLRLVRPSSAAPSQDFRRKPSSMRSRAFPVPSAGTRPERGGSRRDRIGDQAPAHLALQLQAQGHHDLSKTALLEAENIERKQGFSEEGSKQVKYGTRALLKPTRGTSYDRVPKLQSPEHVRIGFCVECGLSLLPPDSLDTQRMQPEDLAAIDERGLRPSSCPRHRGQLGNAAPSRQRQLLPLSDRNEFTMGRSTEGQR